MSKIIKTIEINLNVENVRSGRKLLIRPYILQKKNRNCKEDYRLHETCSREDDDHDEKRVVAGQACPMAL